MDPQVSWLSRQDRNTVWPAKPETVDNGREEVKADEYGTEEPKLLNPGVASATNLNPPEKTRKNMYGEYLTLVDKSKV